MNTLFKRSDIRFPVLFAIVGVCLISFAGKPTEKSAKPTVFLYPPQQMKYFTIGYNEVAADLLWLRAIQDFDICEQSSIALTSVQLPPAFTDSKDVNPRPPSRCNNSWVFQMIDLITELAPRFRVPYETGATMLSILVDDREGALKIYEKGVAQFPTRWQLHYRLGYHYLYEIQNLEKAAFHMKAAADRGAPEWVYALVGKIYSKAGQVQIGISVLEEALTKVDAGADADRIQHRLDTLKAELKKAQATEKAN
ncbi:MAG: hypothetical protein V4692_10285 [Bdellovibrionota bacterium]